jgi:hypothetical protein
MNTPYRIPLPCRLAGSIRFLEDNLTEEFALEQSGTIRIAAPHSLQTGSIMRHLGFGLSIIPFISEV